MLRRIASRVSCSKFKMIVLKILSIATVMSSLVKSERFNNTTQAMNYLLNEDRYDKRLRPDIYDNVVMVTVGMTIVGFGQIREKEMEFSIDIFLYQKWYDKRLSHSLPYPITLSGNHKEYVWMPDTSFLNIKTAKTHTVPSDIAKLTIWNDGLIRFSTRLTLTAGCEMKFVDYPLDTQACNLTFISYSYTVEDLDYQWAGSAEDSIEIMSKAMNEFDLKGITLMKETQKYSTGSWAQLNMRFTFQRRIGYALLQVYAPTLLIVALSWLSFWISKDASSARIGLGIITVLTIVTLMASLRGDFPKVSYVKSIDLFFIVSFLFVFGAIMEYIVVLLKYAMKENADKDRKERQKNITQEFNKEFMESSSSLENQTKGKESGTIREDVSISQNGSDKSSCNEYQRKKIRRKTIQKTKNVEHDADTVDRFSRVAFPLGYLLFNVIYWLYYSLLTFN